MIYVYILGVESPDLFNYLKDKYTDIEINFSQPEGIQKKNTFLIEDDYSIGVIRVYKLISVKKVSYHYTNSGKFAGYEYEYDRLLQQLIKHDDCFFYTCMCMFKNYDNGYSKIDLGTENEITYAVEV